jgi:BirA family biotin operon repressor/biotin-[acetyl-CoA-carboxylase] ligase
LERTSETTGTLPVDTPPATPHAHAVHCPAPERWDLAALAAALDSAAHWGTPAPAGLAWELIDATGSTSDDLILRARAGTLHACVLRAARHQQAGRGRRGRRWLGSDHASLLFSCALPWPRELAQSPAVTLAIAADLAALLATEGAVVQVKWPNDLLVGEGKLGGILAERVSGPGDTPWLVVGLGLNLLTDPELARDAGQPVAALAESLGSGRAEAREYWLVRLGLQVLHTAGRYAGQGLAPWRDSYRSRMAWVGESVTLNVDALATASGRLRGIDADGRVLLEGALGMRAHDGGELRRTPPA